MREDTNIRISVAIPFERSERSNEEITNIKIIVAIPFERIVDNI